MRTIFGTLRNGTARPALFMTASLAIAALVASMPAEARVGVGRPGIGVGRVGSGLGYRPGLGVGRAGLGVRGWRGRVGYGGRLGYRGLGYGAAAVTGAALGYAASSYYGNPDSGYGYGDPYSYTGLYSYSPADYYGSGSTCH